MSPKAVWTEGKQYEHARGRRFDTIMSEEKDQQVTADQWGSERERVRYWTLYLNSPEGQDIASEIAEGEDFAQFLRFDGWLYHLERINDKIVVTVVRKRTY